MPLFHFDLKDKFSNIFLDKVEEDNNMEAAEEQRQDTQESKGTSWSSHVFTCIYTPISKKVVEDISP